MSRARLPYLPGLEGLRGVAVAVVMLFHAEVAGFGGGFLGVSTFFTLSGFLITSLLMRERESSGRIALPAFWGRRLRRLMPAALLTLAGIAIGGALWGDATQQASLRGDGLAALFYVANWWLIGSGADYASLLGSPSPVQHFWSLAIEEQYYVVYPLIVGGLLLVTRGARSGLAALLVAASLASWGWMAWLAQDAAVPTARIYFGTDTRCAELLVGGALALWLGLGESPREGSRALDALGLLSLAVSAAFCWAAAVESPWLYTWGLPVFTLSTAGIVAAAVAEGGPVRALLALPPLRWLGRVSYGAYLYHWPVFLWLDPGALGLHGETGVALQLAVTLALAELSYRFLEEPIRSGRALLAWRRWAAPLTAFACVASLFVALAPPSTRSAPDPLAPKPLAADAVRVLVVGDSLAQQVALGLQRWGAATGAISVEDAAIPGCGMARGRWRGAPSRLERRCDRRPELIRPTLARFDPEIVVVSTAGWDLLERRFSRRGGLLEIGSPVFDEWMLEQFAESVSLLSTRGARIAWVAPPCFVNRLGPQEGVFDPQRVQHYNSAILPALASSHEQKLEVIDLYAEVCPGGRFAEDLHGMRDFRPDGVHFSDEATTWVGQWLGPQLVAAARQSGVP